MAGLLHTLPTFFGRLNQLGLGVQPLVFSPYNPLQVSQVGQGNFLKRHQTGGKTIGANLGGFRQSAFICSTPKVGVFCPPTRIFGQPRSLEKQPISSCISLSITLSFKNKLIPTPFIYELERILSYHRILG